MNSFVFSQSVKVFCISNKFAITLSIEEKCIMEICFRFLNGTLLQKMPFRAGPSSYSSGVIVSFYHLTVMGSWPPRCPSDLVSKRKVRSESDSGGRKAKSDTWNVAQASLRPAASSPDRMDHATICEWMRGWWIDAYRVTRANVKRALLQYPLDRMMGLYYVSRVGTVPIFSGLHKRGCRMWCSPCITS